MTSSTKFTFPHETLTPIIGKPTNTTLQLLQRQLFTNARSVPSARGGGTHGHLAMVLRQSPIMSRALVSRSLFPSIPVRLLMPSALLLPSPLRYATYKQAIDDVSLYNNLSAAVNVSNFVRR
jgi:hypothetical protein